MRPQVNDRLPVARHPDGQWLYAPTGVLVATADGSRVVCHACGEPLAWLSPAHLARDGLTPASYRELFGLNRKQTLSSPQMRRARADEGRSRYAANEALRSGLRVGQTMAREGELNVLGVAAQPGGSRRQQGRRAATRVGASGPLRESRRRITEQAAARWGRRARALGFVSLDDYLDAQRREGASAWKVRRDLGTGGGTADRLLLRG